jgi:hypothetical protein
MSLFLATRALATSSLLPAAMVALQRVLPAALGRGQGGLLSSRPFSSCSAATPQLATPSIAQQQRSYAQPALAPAEDEHAPSRVRPARIIMPGRAAPLEAIPEVCVDINAAARLAFCGALRARCFYARSGSVCCSAQQQRRACNPTHPPLPHRILSLKPTQVFGHIHSTGASLRGPSGFDAHASALQLSIPHRY